MYRCEQWGYADSCGCPGHWSNGNNVFEHRCSDSSTDADGRSDLWYFIDKHVVVVSGDADGRSLIVEFRAGVYCELNWDVHGF